jgi:hypothetical protein
MEIAVRVEGDEAVIDKLLKYAEKYPEIVAEEFYGELLDLERECKYETPWRTGILSTSIEAQKPEIKDKVISSTIGTNVEYAVYVHENMTARHNEPGKAKFIEDPAKRWAARLVDRMGTALERRIDDVA